MKNRRSASQPAVPHDIDARIIALAARQHGVISRAQLMHAGLAAHRIEYRVKRGRLQPIHRGVYRIGPIVARRSREMAAVLACGETAVVSHRSAAALWRLIPAQQETAPVDVSIRDRLHGPSTGVHLHRVGVMRADEIARLDGVPVTAPARSLVDLASCVGLRELERAVAQADRRGLAKRESIERLLERHSRRRGVPRLRALLHGDGHPALTRSEAEERFLALIRKARLGTPELNVTVRGYEVDCLWRAERLVAEIDGFEFHSSPEAFELDRRRDAVLVAAGFRVIRTTWQQLSNEPEAVLVRVGQALAMTGALRGSRG
ncbi:MAG: type IV toxin-antitoxin system AbiEi family antitoxin domain-containing protein [Longimicrobiales bacterium]